MNPLPGVSPSAPALTCDNGQSGTGRRSNVDPLLDRINLVRKGAALMAIVPVADSTDSTPPNLYATRMSRVDGCPECVRNLATPSSVYDGPNPGGFFANYICESCGYAWTTGWVD